MKNNNFNKIKQKISHDKIKENLELSSLYLTAYELLKSSIVDQIRNFFMDISSTGEENKQKREYKNEVLTLDKDPLYASCLWLKKMEAISEDDINKIKLIRNHRNQIAHELASILIDPDILINKEYVENIIEMVKKIDTWWFMEVEIMFHPELSNQENIDFKSGPMILLDYLNKIILKKL